LAITTNRFRRNLPLENPAQQHLVASNSREFIEAVTKTALSTPVERLRIEVLTLLTGVSWPTASVLLHFGHSAPYPILDFRALWSLSIDFMKIRYDFDFWWSYTQFCRKLASDAGVSMRVLDRLYGNIIMRIKTKKSRIDMTVDNESIKVKLSQNINALIGEIGEKQVLLRLSIPPFGLVGRFFITW